MDFSQIASNVISCILSVGGISSIIIATIKFSSNIISDRLSAKYENKLEKVLEKYKVELNKKEYVSRARFDTEFEIYRNLSKEFNTAIKNISLMIPDGLNMVSVDEKKRKEYENTTYVDANNSVAIAQDVLYSNCAFISEQLYNKYNEILKLCYMQLNAFKRRFDVYYYASQKEKESFSSEEYERTSIIQQKWININNEVRSYLSKLDVIE